jgi:DNA-binding MarR family transcriptional regulator
MHILLHEALTGMQQIVQNICMRTQITFRDHLTEPQRLSWKAFFLVGHLMEEFVNADLAKANVGTQSEYDVLYTLDQAPGSILSMKDLSASLTLSHSGLSRMIDRLEEQGYVSRCGVEADKRSVGVQLEDTGRERLRSVWGVMSETVAERFGRVLSDQDHEQLLKLMEKLLPQLISEKERRTKLPFLHHPKSTQ